MGDTTAIPWCDKTFNPWEGCQKVGPGCDNCYAEARNIRYAEKGATVAPNWGPGAPRRRTSVQNWNKPLKWQREAEAFGTRPFVFTGSLCDVFDNAVDSAWRRDLFDLIRATPNLQWLLLTKRPGNVVDLYGEAMLDPPDGGSGYPWPANAAIGCTIVNQEEADRDIPKLLRAKDALKPTFAFLSMEPLLGPVDVSPWLRSRFDHCHECARPEEPGDAFNPPGEGCPADGPSDDCGAVWTPRVEWVIAGGESGPKARLPVERADWFRHLRDQCAAAGVPFDLKQLGGTDAAHGGDTLDGRVQHERPAVAA